MTVETPLRGTALEEALERASAEAPAPPDAAPGPEGGGDAPDRGAPEGSSPASREARALVTVSTTVLAAAIMLGGIFIGAGPRIYAAVGGIAGVLLALGAARSRHPAALYAWMGGGIFAVGIILVLPAGFDAVTGIARELRVAIAQSDLLRPPVAFIAGWHAILGWTMACVGFAAAWVALEMRRPALGLLVPVPLIAFGAISVPESQQLASGLASLALLAAGLGFLSSLQQDDDENSPGLAYELRRAARAVPLVGGVVALLWILSQFNLLFPPPLYDPTEQARLPRTQPITEVEDRVLFEVAAEFTGPWKMGSLDVYDGNDWRLPPFREDLMVEIPRDGIVDPEVAPGAAGEFTIRGLAGAVLPGLVNTHGLSASIPSDMKLAYDTRIGTFRITQGQVRSGFPYRVVAGAVPRIDELREVRDVPDAMRPFLEVPPPPPAVAALLAEAPTDSLWTRMDFLRQHLLETVRAAGQGIPVSIPPERVGEMLTADPQATPFEIVAAQALLARWAGVPARIGYGFDGGEPGPREGTLLIRPRHGAAFLEVYFAGFGWLPVIGDPLQAMTTFTDMPQQFNPDVLATDEVAVPLIIPEIEVRPGQLFEAVRRVVAAVAPVIMAMALLYVLWPLPYKAARRARRRTWALQRGPAARIALAYTEWRDAVTDFGYGHTSDPPLLFLTRFPDADEHTELAWLAARALWGDLQGDVSVDDALAAEQLSAALRRRVSRAHPWTLRTVASLSRLSIRSPYAPNLEALVGSASSKEVTRVAA